MLVQLRVPLLNSVACQPLASRARRKSTRITAVTSAADSDPIESPNSETSLILTSSEGSETANSVAIRQRARFVVSSVGDLLRVNCEGASHSPAVNAGSANQHLQHDLQLRSRERLRQKNDCAGGKTV
jgi:hypothetical protein